MSLYTLIFLASIAQTPATELSPSVFVFDVAGGQMGVNIKSPIVYAVKNANNNQYSNFVEHAFRDSQGKIHLPDKEGTYRIKGRPAKVRISSENPEIFDVTRGIYQIKKEGETKLKIGFVDKNVYIPIKAVKLNINYGDKYEDVIDELGQPDEEKMITIDFRPERHDDFYYSSSGIFRHWRYKEFPHLVISLNLKNKIEYIGNYRAEGPDEFEKWKKGMLKKE